MRRDRQPADVNLYLALLMLVVLPWAAHAETQPATSGQAVIAIIIDDLGNNIDQGEMLLEIPGAITYSFLPHTPHAHRLAVRAHQEGKEVMVHLPMESLTQDPLGPGGLTQNMTEQEFLHTLEESIASVPYAAGLNNHMGSLLTRHPGAMNWLMEEINRHDTLFFIDSRTVGSTVVRQFAEEHAVPFASRDVFLDNDRDPLAIRRQLISLFTRALENGHAIGIGHPYPETALVLRQELANLQSLGISLIPASSMVEHQERQRTWQASSSPSPKVAKNSKP